MFVIETYKEVSSSQIAYRLNCNSNQRLNQTWNEADF